MSVNKIAVVMSGFPRRSETFANNELLALERRGALAGIFTTRPGDDGQVQPGIGPLMDLVHHIPEGSPSAQAEFVVDTLSNKGLKGVHGYFAHAPAEVALHAAKRLGIKFGFSTHARDARKVSATELIRRAEQAACVVACNTDVASTIREAGARRVHLVPHGVDLNSFKFCPPATTEPFQILAVGRLVEKKGFHFLIAAAAKMEVPFTMRIVGAGPEQERLEMMIARNELQDRVVLCGPTTHGALPEEYARAHVVAVPSIVDATGDRDGLPNVVLEAMACGRPVIASDTGAISVALRDGVNGILLRAGDPVALAAALTKLADDRTLCTRLAQTARKLVEQNYELTRCCESFCQLLQDIYA